MIAGHLGFDSLPCSAIVGVRSVVINAGAVKAKRQKATSGLGESEQFTTAADFALFSVTSISEDQLNGPNTTRDMLFPAILFTERHRNGRAL